MTESATKSTAHSLPSELREELVVLIESGKLELPVLPEVANQVITASMDAKCDIRQLTTLINRDQSMTAHVLRLSNSALYCPAVPIVSLQQALSRLGLRKIREIALIISCESRVFKVNGFDLAVRAQFKHSLTAAAFAQEIARGRRWNVEEAFLCGLMHDMGKPVLLQAIVELKEKRRVEVDRDTIVAAASEFHAKVGAELVTSWNLPARLSETIRYHHDPEAAPEAAQTAMMTNLADDLTHFALGASEMSEEGLRSHPMNVPLNVYPEELDHLLEKKDQILEMVEAIA